MNNIVWPDWQVKQLIGEGAFGKVYEITRNSFGIEEHRAMKVISIPTCQAEYERTLSDGMDENSATSFYRSMVNEFVKEISILSQLRGTPNIVVYDDYKVVEHIGSFGWDIYIMMELLTPLSKVLRNGAMSRQEIVKVGTDICDALSVCHKSSILHRDIKIDNIFVSKDGVYKLGDFGIARKAEQTLGVYTKTGTESYMAPEVYKGEPYGKRADIYSLGMVLYRLTNNNRDPFLPPYPQPVTVSDKNYSMVRRMKGEALPKPENASDELGAVILKACSYRQSDRFQSATEFKQALQHPQIALTEETSVDDKTQSAFDNTHHSMVIDEQVTSIAFDDASKTQSAFTDQVSQKTVQAVTPSPKTPKKKTAILVAVIAALVIGIGVVVAVLVSGNSTRVSDDSSYEDSSQTNYSVNNATSNTDSTQKSNVVTPTQSISVEEQNTPEKMVSISISLDAVKSLDYRPTLYVNSDNYSNGISGWPDTVKNHRDIKFNLWITYDTTVELQLDGRTYYRCEFDYETGTMVDGSEIYYTEAFL